MALRVIQKCKYCGHIQKVPLGKKVKCKACGAGSKLPRVKF